MQGAHDFQAVSYQYMHTKITVEQVRQRGDYVKWAVRNGLGLCLSRDGIWEIEPRPSSRDDDFIARTRYDSLDDAFDAARNAYVSSIFPAK